MSRIRAVDLCCGAGGWAAAARGLPIEWVAVADIAEDCLETWRLNHGASHPDCRLLACDLSTPEGVAAVIDATGGSAELVVGGIADEWRKGDRRAREILDSEDPSPNS